VDADVAAAEYRQLVRERKRDIHRHSAADTEYFHVTSDGVYERLPIATTADVDYATRSGWPPLEVIESDITCTVDSPFGRLHRVQKTLHAAPKDGVHQLTFVRPNPGHEYLRRVDIQVLKGGHLVEVRRYGAFFTHTVELERTYNRGDRFQFWLATTLHNPSTPFASVTRDGLPGTVRSRFLVHFTGEQPTRVWFSHHGKPLHPTPYSTERALAVRAGVVKHIFRGSDALGRHGVHWTWE
jgi:hypothetical protein